MSKKIMAAMYLRLSREDGDAPDETLDNHREMLTEYAAKNSIAILRRYEEVVSGASLFARPEMQRMLTDCGSGDFSAILCIDIDRLTRGVTSEQGIILERIKDCNIKIITPEKTYDLANEVDETLSEFKMFFARQEYKSIRKRLDRGKKKIVLDGYYPYEPPFGYRRIFLNRRPTLEIYEPEAIIVREIFDLYVNQGKGSHRVAHTLTAAGINPRKNNRWNSSTVRYLLRNPVYCGKTLSNRQYTVKPGQPPLGKCLKPKKDWVISQGVHEGIVSEDLFDKAQHILDANIHPPTHKEYFTNPFSGLFVCAKCGFGMARNHSNHDRDNRSPETRMTCKTPKCQASSKFDVVEKALAAKLLILADVKVLSLIRTETPDESESALAAAAENEIKSLKKQREKLFDLFERELYDEETFLDRRATIELKLKEAERVFAERKNAPPPEKKWDTDTPEILEPASRAYYFWDRKRTKETSAVRRVTNEVAAATLKTIGEQLLLPAEKRELTPQEINAALKSVIKVVTYARPTKKSPVALRVYFW